MQAEQQVTICAHTPCPLTVYLHWGGLLSACLNVTILWVICCDLSCTTSGVPNQAIPRNTLVCDRTGRGGGVGNSPADRAAKDASLRRSAQERHWQDYAASLD